MQISGCRMKSWLRSVSPGSTVNQASVAIALAVVASATSASAMDRKPLLHVDIDVTGFVAFFHGEDTDKDYFCKGAVPELRLRAGGQNLQAFVSAGWRGITDLSKPSGTGDIRPVEAADTSTENYYVLVGVAFPLQSDDSSSNLSSGIGQFLFGVGRMHQRVGVRDVGDASEDVFDGGWFGYAGISTNVLSLGLFGK